MSPPTSHRRRLCAVLLLLTTLVVGPSFASMASGDGIVDKRVEAKRIATRLATLREQVEILSEAYDDARIRLSDAESRVAAARLAVRRTNHEIARRRRDLAHYAVSAYTGGTDDGSLDLMLKGDTSDIGVREGYASAVVGDKADLVDSLRAAKADGDSTVADLRHVAKQAEDARADVLKERKAASAAVRGTQQVYDRVRGQLKSLVAAEQARQAAASQARAVATARAAAVAVHTTAPSTTAGTAAPSARSIRATPLRTKPAPAPTPPPPPPPAPAATPAPPAAAPVGQGAAVAIAAARSVLGVPYQWSGATPATGFDCSGLVMWAWGHGGKSLPHSSGAQYGMARKIPLSELQPGDLVFYGSPVHHVALYIGGGQIIHAPHTGSVVQVASMYYWDDLVGAGRV
ncbi:MAG: C40 family peptidase [Actinomycetota bacterium]|nr:C40 family peptidase [Actinomycetota bacterium]